MKYYQVIDKHTGNVLSTMSRIKLASTYIDAITRGMPKTEELMTRYVIREVKVP